MIAQNNIIRAWLQVAGFWYVVGVIAWWWHSDYPASSIASVGLRAIMQSAIVIGVGATLGLFGTLVWAYTSMLLRERELQQGVASGRARVLLGDFPALGIITHDPALLRKAHEILDGTPWWPRIAAAAPQHAEAIASVLALMCRVPALPASPVPGGHGGRTLIEHSLAVVETMLKQAGGWVYRGQFDRRGKLRVPLADPDAPHRFSVQEAPLLILTALAHDIGKLACYEPIGQQDAEARTLLVKEVLSNHDVEGGKLLRRLPEVNGLPEDDRRALLLAVTYYHHAFGIPQAPWVTDRMRSLTELLIVADMATGKAEGHTLMEYADDADIAHAPERQEHIAPIAEMIDGAEEAAAPKREWPALARAFKALASKPGAIGGGYKSTRIGVRRGQWIAVIEEKFRVTIGSTLVHLDPDLARNAEAMKPVNNNMAPITASLLEWAAEEGMLYQEHAGLTYGPRRALFRVRYQLGDAPVAGSEGSKGVVAFLLDARKLGLEGTPEAHHVEVLAPYWGEASAQRKSGAAPESATDDGEDADSLPEREDCDALEVRELPAVLETTGLLARCVRDALASLPTPAFETEFEGETVIAIPASEDNVTILEGIANRLLNEGHTPAALGALKRRSVPDDDTGTTLDAYLLPATTEPAAGGEIGG